jgi:hypothetical protein
MKASSQSSWYFLSSVMYSIGQLGLGLLLHPYQTMQMLVEDKIFVWMALIPTLLLGFVTLVWRLFVTPLLIILLSGVSTEGFDVLLIFFTNWFTFFMLFWQVLLLYLLFRFSSVLREN